MRKVILPLIGFIIVILIAFGTGYSFSESRHANLQTVEQTQTQIVQEKVNTIVEKVEVPSIVYRDKVVVKYKTITKTIEKYRENQSSDVCAKMDDEFVTIFNDSVKGVEE